MGTNGPLGATTAGLLVAVLATTTLPCAAASPANAAYRAIAGNKQVSRALELVRNDDAHTLAEQIEIAQIPSPSFKEQVRALDYARRLRELGLTDVTIDKEGNVIGVRKGSRSQPVLVLSAHLDTVFPEGTDVTVRREGDRYYGRGLGDDSRGLAANLSVLRALQDSKIQTVGDIIFVGTVKEEGLGNLRGAKALARDRPDIDGFISVDGLDPPEHEPGAASSIVTQATGSHRWVITFSGPGGHSYENFGIPSAIHAMGRAIARIADLRTPDDPKTTFTVGIVSGGTSINAIAPEAHLQIDLRSNDAEELMKLEKHVMDAAEAGAAEENARWVSKGISVETKLVGDRPVGKKAPVDAPIVQAAVQSYVTLKRPTPEMVAASTDANVFMGLGIPALTVNGGGIGFKAHSPDEWYSPVESWLGPQHIMLTALGLVGIEGVSKPLLPEIKP